MCCIRSRTEQKLIILTAKRELDIKNERERERERELTGAITNASVF